MGMDDELINDYKEKLSHLRIKELKDVLSKVGLSKQGKKQDLMDRIVALLYDEGTPGLFKNDANGKRKLVEVIDDAYRMMQVSGVNGSSSKKQNNSGTNRMHPNDEVKDELERKIQCPCGSDAPSGNPLVQCVDPDCNVWQHVSCVIIPEKPMDKISVPTSYFCELCRLKRADPFWATMAHPLHPVKLASSTLCIDGTIPHLTMEKTFKLTRADRELLQKEEYDVQAWCMLFNDGVPFRMQWPLHAALLVNGNQVKAVNRAPSQLLGTNGRDDGAKISSYIVEGVNNIFLSGADARSFCFGVRLVRRRTLEQVLSMIPKESDGELFKDALARVQRCIGGGITTGNDDSDSDLEVIADSITVNLRCPMSGSRMKTAGRFRTCAHMGCFDLETFVGLNERSRKWQCPICLKNYSLEDVIIDPFFNLILNKMQSCGEEIYEIDMKSDGFWRVKKAQVGDLSLWHHPDGSIQVVPMQQTGQEHLSECHTSLLGLQNNVLDGYADRQGNVDVENFEQNIITMSSTTTGDVKYDGDPSINQDDIGVSDMNEPEISSVLLNFGQIHDSNCQSSKLPSADIIVLSDSEDDDVSLVYPETSPSAPQHHGEYSVSATENKPSSYTDVASNDPVVFSGNADDFMISQSPTPLNLAGGSGFDYFGNPGALLDEHNSATYTGSVDCVLNTGSNIVTVGHVSESYDPHSSSFDHQFPSANGSSPVEVLHPSPSVSQNQLTMLNNGPGGDWISLKTGVNGNEKFSSNMEAHHEPASENGMDFETQLRSKEDYLLQIDHGDTGPVSGSAAGSGSASASGSGSDLTAKRSGSPFTYPRQKRSVRRRSSMQTSKDFTSNES